VCDVERDTDILVVQGGNDVGGEPVLGHLATHVADADEADMHGSDSLRMVGVHILRLVDIYSAEDVSLLRGAAIEYRLFQAMFAGAQFGRA
jgi:hypothetical protein